MLIWFYQFVELEELGYKGLSVHFKGDDVCVTDGTSEGEKAATLEVIEYIHAVITAGEQIIMNIIGTLIHSSSQYMITVQGKFIFYISYRYSHSTSS